MRRLSVLLIVAVLALLCLGSIAQATVTAEIVIPSGATTVSWTNEDSECTVQYLAVAEENGVEIDSAQVTFVWDFDDGTDTQEGDAVEHTFTAEGTYNVQVTATVNGAGSGTASQVIVITGPSTGWYVDSHFDPVSGSDDPPNSGYAYNDMGTMNAWAYVTASPPDGKGTAATLSCKWHTEVHKVLVDPPEPAPSGLVQYTYRVQGALAAGYLQNDSASGASGNIQCNVVTECYGNQKAMTISKSVVDNPGCGDHPTIAILDEAVLAPYTNFDATNPPRESVANITSGAGVNRGVFGVSAISITSAAHAHPDYASLAPIYEIPEAWTVSANDYAPGWEIQVYPSGWTPGTPTNPIIIPPYFP